MPDVRVLQDAVVSYGHQLLTLKAGDVASADLGVFLAGSGSGVRVEVLDEPKPRRRRAAAEAEE